MYYIGGSSRKELIFEELFLVNFCFLKLDVENSKETFYQFTIVSTLATVSVEEVPGQID